MKKNYVISIHFRLWLHCNQQIKTNRKEHRKVDVVE